jgi:hypothetical protein
MVLAVGLGTGGVFQPQLFRNEYILHHLPAERDRVNILKLRVLDFHSVLSGPPTPDASTIIYLQMKGRNYLQYYRDLNYTKCRHVKIFGSFISRDLSQ